MAAVLSIGAGGGQLPLIRAAHGLGYQVVAVDRSPSAEARTLLAETILVSTYDSETVLAQLAALKQRFDFRAVLTRSSGPALLTAARVAESLGLAGIPASFAQAAVYKSALRAQAELLGIATPAGVCLSDASLPGFPLPWVVKPDMPLVGKQNVYKVDDAASFRQAYVAARAESYNDTVEVEAYIAGLDLGYMAMIQQGQIKFGLLYDEFAAFQHGKVQGLGVAGPSVFENTSIASRCHAVAQRLITHWHYQAGFAFFSFRLTEQGELLLYEVNPGLCGDAIADQLLPAIWPGFNAFVSEVKLATAVAPELPAQPPQPHLVIGGELIKAGSREEYLSTLSRVEGGAEIAALAHQVLQGMSA